MDDRQAEWSHAQERERSFYETRAASHEARDQVYAEFHAPFWRGILNRLGELEFRDDGCYVDVGCGPNPIVAFVDRGRRIGIDPLMSFYRDKFVLPEEFEAYDGTIEELEPLDDGQADVIFSMNNIDHIRDLPSAARTLRRKLKDDGYLVVSVNIVGNPITARLARRVDVYRVVDPTHTYHFHSPGDVADSLAEHFEMIRYDCIGAFVEDMATRKDDRDQQRRSVRGVVRKVLKFVKNDLVLRERLHLFLFRPR
jgi:SAM-dependent methyltransferase